MGGEAEAAVERRGDVDHALVFGLRAIGKRRHGHRLGDLDLVDDPRLRHVDDADVAGAEVGDVEQRAVGAEGQIVRKVEAVDARGFACVGERHQRHGALGDVADGDDLAGRAQLHMLGRSAERDGRLGRPCAGIDDGNRVVVGVAGDELAEARRQRHLMRRPADGDARDDAVGPGVDDGDVGRSPVRHVEHMLRDVVRLGGRRPDGGGEQGCGEKLGRALHRLSPLE